MIDYTLWSISLCCILWFLGQSIRWGRVNKCTVNLDFELLIFFNEGLIYHSAYCVLKFAGFSKQWERKTGAYKNVSHTGGNQNHGGIHLVKADLVLQFADKDVLFLSVFFLFWDRLEITDHFGYCTKLRLVLVVGFAWVLYSIYNPSL